MIDGLVIAILVSIGRRGDCLLAVDDLERQTRSHEHSSRLPAPLPAPEIASLQQLIDACRLPAQEAPGRIPELVATATNAHIIVVDVLSRVLEEFHRRELHGDVIRGNGGRRSTSHRHAAVAFHKRRQPNTVVAQRCVAEAWCPPHTACAIVHGSRHVSYTRAGNNTVTQSEKKATIRPRIRPTPHSSFQVYFQYHAGLH